MHHKVSSAPSVFRIAVLSVMALCLASCVVMRDHGMYVGSQCPSWDGTRPAGSGPVQTYIFFPPKLGNRSAIEVHFGSSQKGKLSIGFSGPRGDQDPLRTEGKIIVVFNDRNERREVEVSSQISLEIGESNDFTIIIPPFWLGEAKAPQLEARFYWSDADVYYFQKLM